MSRTSIRTVILSSLAGVAFAALCGLLITIGYMFSMEDFVAQPGSPVYYAGISRLIRSLGVPEGAEDQEYFGSVGDGNKPPQSQLGFTTAAGAGERVWNALDAQLLGQGLQHSTASHDGTDPTPAYSTNLSTVVPTLREVQYRSTRGDLVVLGMHALPKNNGQASVRFSITHFD